MEAYFDEIKNFMKHNKSTKYDFVYDQLVCYGELLSTTIVSEYFAQEGIKHTWLDSRTLIRTDNIYRDATVIWEETQNKITKKIDKEILTRKIGFLLDLANIRHDLKINTKTIYKFNSGVKQKGKFNNKWRLYVNEEFV